jgi:hypothetical protein
MRTKTPTHTPQLNDLTDREVRGLLADSEWGSSLTGRFSRSELVAEQRSREALHATNRGTTINVLFIGATVAFSAFALGGLPIDPDDVERTLTTLRAGLVVLSLLVAMLTLVYLSAGPTRRRGRHRRMWQRWYARNGKDLRRIARGIGWTLAAAGAHYTPPALLIKRTHTPMEGVTVGEPRKRAAPQRRRPARVRQRTA